MHMLDYNKLLKYHCLTGQFSLSCAELRKPFLKIRYLLIKENTYYILFKVNMYMYYILFKS